MGEHKLLYRAGSSGLAYAGIADCSTPHWYCSCGDWRINCNPLSGSPRRETAAKHHRRHVATGDGRGLVR